MPRKAFEEARYNPIAADLVRDVAAAGRTSHPASPIPLVPEPPPATTNVVPITSTKPPSASHPLPAQPAITKRFLLTRGENAELNAFIVRLEQGARTKLTVSVLARALVHLAMQAEEQLLGELAAGFPRALPSTHDSVALGAFEDHWSQCVGNALRKLPRLSRPQSAGAEPAGISKGS